MANPWFVAINSGSDSTFSGADAFGAPSGYRVFQAGSSTDATALSSAATSGQSVSLHNIIWTNVSGPYSSQSAAQAALTKVQATSPAPGLLQQTTGINPNAFSSIQNALSAFYDKVTDGKMWRSLGWIILGIFLLLIGLALLLRSKVESAVGQVARAVAIP
jgi:hypothetical protein